MFPGVRIEDSSYRATLIVPFLQIKCDNYMEILQPGCTLSMKLMFLPGSGCNVMIQRNPT